MYILLLSLVLVLSSVSNASFGDKSDYYQNCLGNCLNTSDLCYAEINNLTLRNSIQPLYKRLLMWDCEEECKYECMWITTDYFIRNYDFVPQYYGKWPFKRIFGIQEPASVIFSITNAIPILLSINKFRKEVPREAPLFAENVLHAVVSVNAWFWSAVFHSRDYPFTEKMDYFCGLSLVMYSVYYCINRMQIGKPPLQRFAVAVGMLAFYAQHIYYMGMVKFDYGYNMKVNVAFGAVNLLLWVIFCTRHWRVAPHARYMLLMNVLLALLLPIELLDFSPLYWALDAHALWHAFTSPLPFLWYSFTIADCKQLHDKQIILEH